VGKAPGKFGTLTALSLSCVKFSSPPFVFVKLKVRFLCTATVQHLPNWEEIKRVTADTWGTNMVLQADAPARGKVLHHATWIMFFLFL